ncbi:MAG: PPOX class F420-dependent oxidoreductase [Candidatus Hodarchaeota archaeon]
MRLIFGASNPEMKLDMSSNNKFDYLKGKRTISLTTYYKSGKAVATPVEFVHHENKLFVSTRKDSYKVKRLKYNSNALIAPCTMRGKITGPETKVKVRILSADEEEVAREALKSLYSGFFSRILVKLTSWRDKSERVFLEIS